MQILQHTLQVPTGNTFKTAAAFKNSSGKVGKVTFFFMNQTNAGLDNKATKAEPILVNIYESDDGRTLGSPLNNSPLAVAGGAEQPVTVKISKAFITLKLKGSNGKGGSMRVNASYEGRQEMGQLDVLSLGKAGYGFDGGTENGQSDGSFPSYPEGAPA